MCGVLEGIIFSRARVCLFRGVPVQALPPNQLPPPDILKLVQTVALTVNKWVVGIGLKCLLVGGAYANLRY